MRTNRKTVIDLRHGNENLQIAIVSDTHGYIDPRILDAIRGSDAVIHAGDIMGKTVLDELRTISEFVITVRGNNDRPSQWQHQNLDELSLIPYAAEILLPGGKIAVEHGETRGFQKPCHDQLRHAYPGCRAIVYGHTHKLVYDHSEKPWILNPGAAGHTRTHGGPTCLLLSVSRMLWKVQAHVFTMIAA